MVLMRGADPFLEVVCGALRVQTAPGGGRDVAQSRMNFVGLSFATGVDGFECSPGHRARLAVSFEVVFKLHLSIDFKEVSLFTFLLQDVLFVAPSLLVIAGGIRALGGDQISCLLQQLLDELRFIKANHFEN